MDELFCLKHHIEYLHDEVPDLSEEDIKEYFDKPFRQAVEYIKSFDRHEKWSPTEKMDYIEKVSRSMIAEIDDYYVKSETEKAKTVQHQNRYKRFRKLQKSYEVKTGKKLTIDYEKMFSYVP